MKCLLCGSEELKISETHLKKELADLWISIYPNVYDDLGLEEINVYNCKKCSLKFFDPKLAGGDRFYSALGELDWYYLHPGKTEYDYVQKYMKPDCKVLDVGSGRGVLFTKVKCNIDYTGLELSTKAVELAKAAGINVIQEDLLWHAKQHPSKYDIVTLFQVLEHLTELDSFIGSIYDSLKSGGLFVIAVPNNNGFISYTQNYTFNLPPHHTILWKESSLRFMADKFGFEVVEVENEPLQDVHKNSAYKAYLTSMFMKLFFRKILLIDKSRFFGILSRRVDALLRIKFFNYFLIAFAKRRVKDGQSIIITLRKK